MGSLHKMMAVLAGTVVVAAGLAVGDTITTKKSSPTKKSATRKSTPAAGTSAASKKSVTATGKRRTTATASRSAQTWRTRQTQPSPERYKEIQQALANKGYLHGEPTGAWNQESSDALRRFQQDQKLESTGKIDSLSLIALGLGPKHEAGVAKPPQAPTPN